MRLAAALVLLVPASVSAQPEYSNEGAKSCLDCHATERVLGIRETAHADRENPKTPAAQKRACESCHGPSKKHMQFPMQVGNQRFGKTSSTPPKLQNQMCLECHGNAAEQEAWHASAHGYEDVVCSVCHNMHDPSSIAPGKATVSSGCRESGCHDTLMGNSPAVRFTHAVGKDLGSSGQLTCTGCHNPHGPLSSGRCIDCHPQTAEISSKETEKARRFHEVAERRGTECIRCHKGLAHPVKPLQLEQQESPEPNNAAHREEVEPQTEAGNP